METLTECSQLEKIFITWCHNSFWSTVVERYMLINPKVLVISCWYGADFINRCREQLSGDYALIQK